MERAIEMSRELDKLHETEPEVYKSYTQMYKLFDIIKEIMKQGWDRTTRMMIVNPNNKYGNGKEGRISH